MTRTRPQRTPLLAGPDAERALALASRMLSASRPYLARVRLPRESIGRFGGAALVADALVRAGRLDQAVVIDLLREAFAFAPDRLSLFDGAAGLLVVLDALDPRRAELRDERAKLRAALAQSLRAAPPGDPAVKPAYDLIGGVAGRAVALRDDEPGALPALQAYAHRFADTVEQRLASDDAAAPALDLGVAHGVPALLAALNFALPHDRALARRYVDLLLSCAHVVGGAHRWGELWRPAERPPARRAWCYGTAGVAAVLRDRALLDGDDALLALAARALAAVLDDPAPDPLWNDALCHGRSGAAALAWRFAADDARGAARFAGHARRLAHEVLGAYDEGFPLGYRCPDPRDPADLDRPSFLDGALGIAQFLTDAATAQERRWLPLFGLLPD